LLGNSKRILIAKSETLPETEAIATGLVASFRIIFEHGVQKRLLRLSMEPVLIFILLCTLTAQKLRLLKNHDPIALI